MKICVFGSSSDLIDKKIIEQTEELGSEMAKRKHSLVFGGGAYGVMGACARGVFKEKGEIIGVAPKFFDKDGVLFKNCTDFVFTETMRERKAYMEDNADAFIIAPGGIGTYEEFFEVLVLKQLGQHCKPIVIFNPFGVYDKMLDMLEDATSRNFMKDSCTELSPSFSNINEIFDYLDNYKGEAVDLMATKYAFLDKK